MEGGIILFSHVHQKVHRHVPLDYYFSYFKISIFLSESICFVTVFFTGTLKLI